MDRYPTRTKGRSMNLNDYQQAAMSTKIYGRTVALPYAILGLAGEAGEVAGALAKAFRDDGSELTETKRTQIIKETGDCLWMIAAIADALGTDLEEIAQVNLEKLASRANRGTLGGSGDER